MLVARRDPPFHSATHEIPHPPAHYVAHAAPAPHSPRFMTALQMVGSLLAIPVGLASGYSIYHANFSAEARCQSLRANIVSMLDKSADASTLRMLVRRDVASFEANCGVVDPDAVAAFKTLLASGKAAAPAPQPVRTAPPQTQAARPVALPKSALAAVAEVKPVKHPQAMSDANWVASVRQALVHAPAAQTEEAKAAPAHVPAAPPHPLGQLRGPVPDRAVAPALPPAAAVAVTPAPAQPSDHPVPPASIPETTPAPQVTQAAQSEHRTGIGGLIAEIPLVGRLVGR